MAKEENGITAYAPVKYLLEDCDEYRYGCRIIKTLTTGSIEVAITEYGNVLPPRYPKSGSPTWYPPGMAETVGALLIEANRISAEMRKDYIQ